MTLPGQFVINSPITQFNVPTSHFSDRPIFSRIMYRNMSGYSVFLFRNEIET